jgi:3-hydroxypropanoate dehydrogenase
MTQPIDTASQAQLFTQARTHNHWQAKPVPENLLWQLYDLCKWGPSSANCSPLRVVFVQSAVAKEKLKTCLQAGNIDKTMTAPVTAVLGMDMQFYEKLPQLFPHADAKSWFAGNDALIAETAFRNSSLQCAYFMLAARALGLDCGPLSGFDRKKCDDLFFAGTPVQSNMLCNLGYGDSSKLQPRLPRLDFADACRIA